MIQIITIMCWQLLRALGIYLLYTRVLKMWYLRYLYGYRGVSFMCKIPKPIVGDTLELAKRTEAEPDRPHVLKVLYDQFDNEIPPCIGMFWPHGMMLMINDPDYVQDLFQKYNNVFTKGDYTQKQFGDLIYNALIWTRSEDKSYKPRRKIVAHAFYGSKLQAMSDTIFEVIHERLLKWPTLYPSGQIDLINELASL